MYEASLVKVHPTIRIAFALVLAAQLGGCDEGWEASERQARDWLPTAKPHLQEVLGLLRTCQPTRAPDHYKRVWVEDHNGGAGPAHCASKLNTGIDKIRVALKKAGVLSVDYAPNYDPTLPVDMASFMLFRAGLGVSGRSTSVSYYSSALPCAGSIDEYRDRQPLTTAPCHWFWERSLS